MKMQIVAVSLTVVNLILMAVLFTKINPAVAQQQQKDLPVLRGSGLEIIDKEGKVRASISFHEAQVYEGANYPAGILFRLIDSQGQPSVKLGAAEDGAGLSLANELQGYIQILAKENNTFLKIKDANGKETVVKP